MCGRYTNTAGPEELNDRFRLPIPGPEGTGRFNLTLGAVTTAVGIGAALSQSIAGGIVHRFGYHAGFLFLALVAAAAFLLLCTAMPETRDIKQARSAPGLEP